MIRRPNRSLWRKRRSNEDQLSSSSSSAAAAAAVSQDADQLCKLLYKHGA